jgi:large subunit ribosomal protein L4
MPEIKVFDMSGKEVGSLALNEKIFGITPNVHVMHEAVRLYLANQRQGTQSTLTRAEVSGGGRKPWRQKGTGHARQGSTRAPHWTHGGIALGPKPRDYGFDLNKKVKRLALCSALSSKVLDGELIVVEGLKMDEYKTKTMVNMFASLDAGKKPLLVLDAVDNYVIKSASNIEGANTALYNTLNVYDILNSSKMVVSKEALLKIEEVYSK